MYGTDLKDLFSRQTGICNITTSQPILQSKTNTQTEHDVPL